MWCQPKTLVRENRYVKGRKDWQRENVGVVDGGRTSQD